MKWPAGMSTFIIYQKLSDISLIKPPNKVCTIIIILVNLFYTQLNNLLKCIPFNLFLFLETKIASRMGFLKGKPLYLDAQATTPLVIVIYLELDIYFLLHSIYHL